LCAISKRKCAFIKFFDCCHECSISDFNQINESFC
jgi:hypothetical protein